MLFLDFLSRVIKSTLQSLIINSSSLSLLLPAVHYEFEKIKEKINIYLKFSSFEPKLVDKLQGDLNYNELDLESCLGSIKIFETTTQKEDVTESLHRLRKLTQLVKTTLTKIKNDHVSDESFNQKYMASQKKFDLLQINYQFMESVLLQNYRHRKDDILKLTCELANILKIRYLKENVQPSNEHVIFDRRIFDSIHEFLGKCVLKAKELLFKSNTVSKCCNTKSSKYILSNINNNTS